MTKVIVGEEPRPPRQSAIDTEPMLAWAVVAGTGLAIAVVGWADLALVWYPLHFDSPEWEFGTISRQLDGMPLATIGLCLLAASAIGQKRRTAVRILAGVCLLVALQTLAISLLYLLDIPLALRGFGPAARPGLIKAMIKAGVLAPTYILLYAWLAWFLWRKTRR